MEYATNEQVVLNVLKPFTRYNISIQAVSNVKGAWSAVVYFVTPEAAPSGAPQNLLVESKDYVSLNVSWKQIPADKRNGLITHYVVEYQKRGTSTVKTENVTGTTLSVKLKYLESGWYDVSVAGHTSAGRGPMTGKKVAQVKEGKPSGAPANLRVESRSPLSLHISWQEIPVDQRNGVINGYRVYYKKSGSAAGSRDVRSPSLTLTLNNLEYGTYEVTVMGYNSVGWGPKTLPQSATTKEGGPTAPQRVEVQAVSSTAIQVTWQPPQKANGILRRYVMKYGTQQDVLDHSVRLGSGLSSYTLQKLEEYTTYYVQIYAETTVTGTPSGTLHTRTLEAAPSASPAIDNTKSKADDAHTISVVWSEIPERDRNGIIRGYRVMYSARGQVATNVLNVIGNVNTRATIQGLKTYTEYCITVVAYTSVGDSPPGVCAWIRTGEEGPSAPRNVSVQVQSSTSVLLRWVEPEQANGRIRGYEITYKIVKDGQMISRRVTGQTYETTITGLSFTEYSFAVRALTTRKGVLSIPVVTTLEDAPSAPVDLLADKSTDTTVLLKWKEPLEPNGRIRGYNVRTFDTNTGAQLGQVVGVLVSCSLGTCSYTVSGLKPYRNITLMVQAVTIKPGNSSNCTAHTLEGAPSAPVNVQTRMVGDTIKVTWDKPTLSNGIIRNYTVYYRGNRPQQESFEHDDKITLSTCQRREVVITKTYPGTEYSIQVAAATNRKEGDKSEPSVVTTPEDIGECASSPCKNGGLCLQSRFSNFTCYCGAGYDGDLCENDIDECASNPCKTGGTCREEINGFSCTYASGNSGKTNDSIIVVVIPFTCVTLVLLAVIVLLSLRLHRMQRKMYEDRACGATEMEPLETRNVGANSNLNEISHRSAPVLYQSLGTNHLEQATYTSLSETSRLPTEPTGAAGQTDPLPSPSYEIVGLTSQTGDDDYEIMPCA